METLRRRLLFSSKNNAVIDGTVDLGLPSGLLWATGNIVQDGSSYKIGKETDYGAYVSWGNIEPHFSSNGSTFDDGYNWGSANTGPYASTPGASISGLSQGVSFASDSGYDAARELLGGRWKMPTTQDFKELNDNCTSEWVTVNGVVGMRLTSNINGNSVFFPAGGNAKGTSVSYRTTMGYYLSRSWYSSDNGLFFRVNSSGIDPQRNANRYIGFNIRAVMKPSTIEFVDLGLSVKWAKGNICKDSNENYYIGDATDNGCYFSWGNILGYNGNEGYDFSATPYNSTPGASLTESIASNDSIHDAALANLENGSRMPTLAEVRELIDNCTLTRVTKYDNINVPGITFRSKKSGYTNAEIFIPYCGYYDGTSSHLIGTDTRCWTSSLRSTTAAYGAKLNASDSTNMGYLRYQGFSIRAVQDY